MASVKTINLLTDCLICEQGRAGRDPRRLDCKHSFCYQCLNSALVLQSTDRVECPVCWETTSVSGRGLTGLPADDKVDTAVEVLAGCEGLYHCKACKMKGRSSRAHARCGSCDREMCEECAKKHVEKQPFSDHLIIRNLCKVHVGDYTHACLTCQSLLCLDCIESELHEGHMICDVMDIAAKASGILLKRKNIIQRKTHELEKLITVTTDRALDKLNKRRRQTEEKLELYRTQLQKSLEGKLNESDDLYHKAVASVLEKQNQACSEAVNIVNEIDNLSRDNKMNIITELSNNAAEMYKALNALSSARGSHLTCPELGDDICTTTEDKDRHRFEFKCTIGGINEGSETDLKSKPNKQVTLKSLGGVDIANPYWIKQGPGSTVIVGDFIKTQATRINMNGEVVETYQTADNNNLRGVAVHNNTVYVLSQNGKTVASHTGGQVQVINLRPQVQKPSGIDTDGESLLIVERSQKLLRYSYQGELLQQFDSPGIYYVSYAVHPDTDPVYLVSDHTEKLVHVLRQDGGRVRSLGGHGQNDGQFTYPRGTAMLRNGNILVADYSLQKVSKFIFDGVFIRPLLTTEDGLSQPYSLCVSLPYLWVGCNSRKGLLLFKYPN